MFQYLSPFKEKRGLICGPLILSAGSASEGGGGGGIWHKDEFTRCISKTFFFP